jgi:hypothetical protein
VLLLLLLLLRRAVLQVVLVSVGPVSCQLLQLLAAVETELVNVECCGLNNLPAGAASGSTPGTPLLG